MTKQKDTIQSVRKENDELKKQLEEITKELKVEIRVGAAEGLNKQEGKGGRDELQERYKAIDWLSQEYDDLNESRSTTKEELLRINKRLFEITKGVNDMSNAIDELERYSYQYNVKLIEVSEMKLGKQTVADTSSLCVTLFNEMGADVTISDIDIAHRVPLRNATNGPKPIICKFTRRLVKERVMAKRYELGNLE